MMRAIEAIVVILAVGVGVAVIATVVMRRLARGWRLAHSPWRMEEHSDGEAVKVLAVKPGDDDLMIGYVPFGSPDFDSRLYELRAEGRSKVYTLNQRGDGS